MSGERVVFRHYDPVTGITEEVVEFWKDGALYRTHRAYADVSTQHRVIQDVRNERGKTFSKQEDGVFHAATIHPLEITKMQKEYGFDPYHCDPQELRKVLNKAEYRHLKTKDVKL